MNKSRKQMLALLVAVLFAGSLWAQVPEGYVDLGLPSGTLWKASNETGHYDYDGAIEAFGKSVPTREQWEELKEHCWWVWNEEDETTAAVVGENGNFILLPAEGFFQPPIPIALLKKTARSSMRFPATIGHVPRAITEPHGICTSTTTTKTTTRR